MSRNPPFPFLRRPQGRVVARSGNASRSNHGCDIRNKTASRHVPRFWRRCNQIKTMIPISPYYNRSTMILGLSNHGSQMCQMCQKWLPGRTIWEHNPRKVAPWFESQTPRRQSHFDRSDSIHLLEGLNMEMGGRRARMGNRGSFGRHYLELKA